MDLTRFNTGLGTNSFINGRRSRISTARNAIAIPVSANPQRTTGRFIRSFSTDESVWALRDKACPPESRSCADRRAERSGRVDGSLRNHCQAELFSNIAHRPPQKLPVQPTNWRTARNSARQTRRINASNHDGRSGRDEYSGIPLGPTSPCEIV